MRGRAGAAAMAVDLALPEARFLELRSAAISTITTMAAGLSFGAISHAHAKASTVPVTN